jgi:transcriptional regulator with XRE-family HTH domain
LRAIRTARGLTAKQLAGMVGISLPGLCHFEHRRWPAAWRTLSRLADALGSSTDAILERAPLPAVAPDALAVEDRKLLDAMRLDFEQWVGPQVRRLTGLTWRSLARSAWLGLLIGLRDGTRRIVEPRGQFLSLPPGPKLPTPPEEWETSWESPRQQARAAEPPRPESRKALARVRNRIVAKAGT